jgi:POT family
MDRNIAIGHTTIVVPAASMPLFDTGAILLLIPVYNNFLHPLLKRLQCELSVLTRMALGFAISAAAMFVAGIVERWRIDRIEDNDKLTVLAQIPQYAMVGASEVFAAVGQLEFFYNEVSKLLLEHMFNKSRLELLIAGAFQISSWDTVCIVIVRMLLVHQRLMFSNGMQAPESMRSVAAAFGLLSVAGGGYLSAALLSIVASTTSWLDNINDPSTSRLDDYLTLLGLFMLANTLLFVWVSYGYKTV